MLRRDTIDEKDYPDRTAISALGALEPKGTRRPFSAQVAVRFIHSPAHRRVNDCEYLLPTWKNH